MVRAKPQEIRLTIDSQQDRTTAKLKCSHQFRGKKKKTLSLQICYASLQCQILEKFYGQSSPIINVSERKSKAIKWWSSGTLLKFQNFGWQTNIYQLLQAYFIDKI